MSDKRPISFTLNFNASVGQNINHVDKLEVHFDKDMTMQVVDTKGMIENSSMIVERDTPADSHAQEVPSSVTGCFYFSSEYVRQQVDAIVREFYLDRPVNLALIEVVLYDHSQLRKRNNHTSFVKSLVDWGILPDSIDIKKIANGMADKFKSLPWEGYKQWGDSLLNERNRCDKIGAKLDASMRYSR